MTVPARKTHLQVIHEISGQGGFGQTSGIIGTLPAGCVVQGIHALTSQAFNSTTNTLSLGAVPGGNGWLNAQDIKAVGRVDVVPAVGSSLQSVDNPVYYTLASTGAAPTQGVITVWLDYLPGPG